MADSKLFAFEAMISRTSDQTDLYQFVVQILERVSYEAEFRDAIRYALAKMVHMRARCPRWWKRFCHEYRATNHNFRDPTGYQLALKTLYDKYFWIKEFTIDDFRALQRWIIFYLNHTIPYHFLKRLTHFYLDAVKNHGEASRLAYNAGLVRLNINSHATELDEHFRAPQPITLKTYLPTLMQSLPPVVRNDSELPLLIWDSKFAHPNHLGEWKIYQEGEENDD